jgi:hypothetical protein
VLREPIPVYYCLLFDITGRDANGYETQGPGGDGHGIVWLPSDDHVLQYGGALELAAQVLRCESRQDVHVREVGRRLLELHRDQGRFVRAGAPAVPLQLGCN